ncbi:DNA-directed primase/polymerase protein-like [Planococcus citri]|uniref:DNA-directed primase/polymerase protein-like n=1 Tax=Planococcus citri TaxID=170843 RepID=UPI0031F992A0
MAGAEYSKVSLINNIPETMELDESKQSTLSAQFSGGINPNTFYGPKKYHPTFHTTGTVILPPQSSAKFKKLSGPSLTWETFKKQDQVIEFVSRSNCDLMPFVYQSNGTRAFLAAHPLTFWHYDEQREMKDRHSYEIIREFKTCKLYFDLEYEISKNRNHNGRRMVKNFIHLVMSALKYKYDIECNFDDVLILDSTTESKFSCHLIFQLKKCYFRDNYNVGYFVKQLCHEIRLWIIAGTENENLLLLPFVDLPYGDIEEFEVIDSKGNKTLFCDEAVYSKNRHFRLYKSTKFGKNAPLLESPDNKFVCENSEDMFLHSLITWISGKESHVCVEFAPNKLHYSLKIYHRTSNYHNQMAENPQKSPFPELDQCILDIVHPGKIYRSAFFKENNTIVYDIVGNRFCWNIGRVHKSNNVKYVIDLHTLTYYQKCYDPDCANFKSAKKGLPISEHFFLNNDIDDDLVATAEDHYRSAVQDTTSEDLFSCDISDEQFCEMVKPCEELLQGKNLSNDESFLDESYDADMVSVADYIEGNINTEKCDRRSNVDQRNNSELDFSNEVDDSLIIAEVEKLESIYSPPKK